MKTYIRNKIILVISSDDDFGGLTSNSIISKEVKIVNHSSGLDALDAIASLHPDLT